jgi:hypothetical protein
MTQAYSMKDKQEGKSSAPMILPDTNGYGPRTSMPGETSERTLSMTRMIAFVGAIAFLPAFGLTGLPLAAAEEAVDIWTAAAKGDLEAIERQLSAGTDMNAMAPSIGVTPLMAAAITGQEGAAELLLANGAKPDIGNKEGATALHMAAFFGQLEIVKALVAKGADIHQRWRRLPLSPLRGDTEVGASGRIIQAEPCNDTTLSCRTTGPATATGQRLLVRGRRRQHRPAWANRSTACIMT